VDRVEAAYVDWHSLTLAGVIRMVQDGGCKDEKRGHLGRNGPWDGSLRYRNAAGLPGVRKDRAMESISWPKAWQPEARAALLQFIDADDRVEIIVGDPLTSVDGSVIAGHVYLEGADLMIIYDRSGRADVYPWRLLAGPVLEIVSLSGRRRRSIYLHPQWTRPRRA
jgi:hypothetical protein